MQISESHYDMLLDEFFRNIDESYKGTEELCDWLAEQFDEHIDIYLRNDEMPDGIIKLARELQGELYQREEMEMLRQQEIDD